MGVGMQALIHLCLTQSPEHRGGWVSRQVNKGGSCTHSSSSSWDCLSALCRVTLATLWGLQSVLTPWRGGGALVM